MMNIYDAKQLEDYATIAITGKDLKQILYYAEMLRSGLAPKAEMCFQWGDNLHRIINGAIEI